MAEKTQKNKRKNIKLKLQRNPLWRSHKKIKKSPYPKLEHKNLPVLS